jgi:nondiscriminating glutamyl-tRNA synthetase
MSTSSSSSKPVRVRFAPSPTGYLHIGGLRSAFYNWLFARKHGGTFILRVEDTDRSRYVEGAIQNLYSSLAKCDLRPDEGISVKDGQVVDEGSHAPYLQSSRREKHSAYAKELIAKGHAYYCFCTKDRLAKVSEEQQLMKKPMMYDRHCRTISKEEAEKRAGSGEEHVIRLAVPTEGSIVFEDMIRGRIEIPWAQVDDQVLMKSDGFPTYHLAATCDDHDMEISHVIRGEEWLSSLPKHLFIFQVFGWEAPKYAHLPLLLNPDRSKLSKRQGDVAVEDYLSKGYLPEALVNFVALLGWNPTSDREIFTKEELAQLFDITKVNKSGAVFNLEKLNWLNAHYLKTMTEGKYLEVCRPWLKDVVGDEALKDRACLLVRDRVNVLSELPELTAFLFKDVLEYDPAILCWKTQPKEEAKERLTALRTLLQDRSEAEFSSVQSLDADIRAFIVSKGWGNGDTLWPLRVALSGAKQSPGPFELLVAYGKDRSLARLDAALAHLA